jgi:hypothetical protein
LDKGLVIRTYQEPRSSAWEGGVTAAGTAALTAGSYVLEKRLTKPERFAELVTSSKPKRTLDLSQLNRLQRPLAQARFGAEHFGNFVKQAANTTAGKGALAFTAITALGLGALSAWQTDHHNKQITEKLGLENTRLLNGLQRGNQALKTTNDLLYAQMEKNGAPNTM